MNKRFLFIIFCSLGSLSIAFSALSEEIFRWTDEAGRVHYSSEPANPKAKPADLPPIMRGEVKLTKPNILSCAQHGGIDCQAGADSDGSVICFDGFAEATAPYRFSCSSPKLSISSVSDPDSAGIVSVIVRNSKSVEARDPKVYLKSPIGEELELDGPAKIDAFGMAEFKISKELLTEGQKPEEADLRVHCLNCP